MKEVNFLTKVLSRLYAVESFFYASALFRKIHQNIEVKKTKNRKERKEES